MTTISLSFTPPYVMMLMKRKYRRIKECRQWMEFRSEKVYVESARSTEDLAAE